MSNCRACGGRGFLPAHNPHDDSETVRYPDCIPDNNLNAASPKFKVGDRVFFPIQMTVTAVTPEWVHVRYDDGTEDVREPSELALIATPAPAECDCATYAGTYSPLCPLHAHLR